MSVKSKDYYTTKEAAQLLNVAVSTVQLWSNNGILRAWATAGGHRRIACQSVDDMLRKKVAAADARKLQKKVKLVIVEDDAQQRRLYEKHIENWDMDVDLVMADDGYEGLIKIGTILPDIIITDLMMPNMDGFHMIRALNVMPELSQTVIIAISALGGNSVKIRGGLPSGVHLITKPISFVGLEKFVSEQLSLKAAKK